MLKQRVILFLKPYRFADRWHLLRNLNDALHQILQTNHAVLSQAANAVNARNRIVHARRLNHLHPSRQRDQKNYARLAGVGAWPAMRQS